MKRLRSSLLITLILLFCVATPLSALTINSPAGIIIDASDGGALYEKNADALRPCASTTKLMSLLLIFEDIDAGKISMDTRVTISAEIAAASRNTNWSNAILNKGQSYSVRELVSSIAVNSACASTMAMAQYLDGSSAAFVSRMNQRAAALGLNATYADETGLSSNCKITARSLAKLSDYLIDTQPEILGFTALTSVTIGGRTYETTNELLPGRAYYYEGADGLKTGSTTPAGKCFVGTAQRNGERIIMAILGAPTLKQRYTDAVAMLDYGFQQAPLYPLTFKDVATTDWFYDAVKTGYDKKWVDGTGTYTYEPDKEVTRAMFVTVLGRIWEQSNGTIAQNSSSDFPDVVLGSWYQTYVDWAAKNKIVLGFEDGTFRPEEKISREQMMEILCNYNTFLQNGEAATTDLGILSKFADADTISDWAKDSAAWCVANGVINGVDSTHIAPLGTANRAQMITVFVNYIR